MKSNLKINFIRLTKFLLTVIVSINFNQQNKRKRKKEKNSHSSCIHEQTENY